MSKDKVWICEVTCIARKTLLITAPSKKEAQRLLGDGEGDGIDVSYGDERSRRVVCRDGYSRKPKGERP